MRNLQKILALVLALIMSFSLVATAGAFSDDGDISDAYKDAVTVLNGLEVFKGYDNGATFQPKGNITRAEVAAIIYRIATGDVKDTQASIYSTYGQFTDVLDGSWYAGYVNYCANAGYIKGRGNKIFDPQATVTGYEALAMILRAVGYDKNGEFTGSNWQIRTASIANERGISKNVTSAMLGQAATREVVAELLFRSIIIPKVNFNANTLSYTEKPLNADGKKDTLGYESLKLEEIEGVVTANEYADLEGTSTLSAGRTRMHVDGADARDYNLDIASTLDDIGESRVAYIQNGNLSKVFVLSSTGDNVIYDDGKDIDVDDARKEAKKEGSDTTTTLKLDDSTQYFRNYDPIEEQEAKWRIEYVYKMSNTALAAAKSLANSDSSRTVLVNGRDAGILYEVNADGSRGNQVAPLAIADADRTTLGTYEYVKVIPANNRLSETDKKCIREIFRVADYQNGSYIDGEVYVGTTSQAKLDDISDDISYNEFVSTYINTIKNDDITSSDLGYRLKLIDNNDDTIVDYVLQTVYTVTKIASVSSDNKYTLMTKNISLTGIDEVNNVDNDIDVVKFNADDELKAEDVVLYAVIDGKAQTWLAESTSTKVDKIDRGNKKVTTTDGTEYADSDVNVRPKNADEARSIGLGDDVVDMTGNNTYSLYFDLYGNLAAFNEADEAFVLVVDGWYNSTKGGAEYAVKVWEDGSIQTKDVTSSGELFIEQNTNNDWGQIRDLGAVNANGGKALNADRTLADGTLDPKEDNIRTTVALLNSDGVMTPVDMAYHTIKTNAMIAMDNDQLPDRVGKAGRIYNTRTNINEREAYNADGGAASVQALSTTKYYFVYNAYSDWTGRTISKVVREYTGYQNLPKDINGDPNYLDHVEDVYVVGTRASSATNSVYYTADIVVVELDNTYYKTLGGEQVFIPYFPVVGTSVTREEVELIRQSGVKETVTLDLTRSDIRYYDDAQGIRAGGLYYMWQSDVDSNIYYVRSMSAADIAASQRYYVGMVNYSTGGNGIGTLPSNYVDVDIYGRDVNGVCSPLGQTQRANDVPSSSKYYTLKYNGSNVATLAEVSREAALTQRPEADRSRADYCPSGVNEFTASGGYQLNEVLVAYNVVNGYEEIAYVVSFNEYQSYDGPNTREHTHDRAQTVWGDCLTVVGGVTPDPDAAKVAAAKAVLNGMNYGAIVVPYGTADAETYVKDEIAAKANAAQNSLVITAADVTIGDISGIGAAPVAVNVSIALKSGAVTDAAAGTADVSKEDAPAEYTLKIDGLEAGSYSVTINGNTAADGDVIHAGDTISVSPDSRFLNVTNVADGKVTGDVTISIVEGASWTAAWNLWTVTDANGSLIMLPFMPTAARMARSARESAVDWPEGEIKNPPANWVPLVLQDTGATYTIQVDNVVWTAVIGQSEGGATEWKLTSGTIEEAKAAAGKFFTATLTKVKAAGETPAPETGTVSVSVKKPLQGTNATMKIKAETNGVVSWEDACTQPIVDGVVTVTVKYEETSGNYVPVMVGGSSARFVPVNGAYQAVIPASDGDKIEICNAKTAKTKLITLSQGSGVTLLGAKSGQKVVEVSKSTGSSYDSAVFTVTVPAGYPRLVGLTGTGAATADIAYESLGNNKWQITVTAADTLNATVTTIPAAPQVTVESADAAKAQVISGAAGTAPDGSYVFDVLVNKGSEPLLLGGEKATWIAKPEGHTATMDCWTVTVTEINENTVIRVTGNPLQTMKIIGCDPDQGIALGETPVKDHVRVVDGKAEFTVYVKPGVSLDTAGAHDSANTGTTVTITPAGEKEITEGQLWGAFKFVVEVPKNGVASYSVLKSNLNGYTIHVIAPVQTGISVPYQKVFSYAATVGGNTTKAISFKVTTNGAVVPVVRGTDLRNETNGGIGSTDVSGNEIKAVPEVKKTENPNEWEIRVTKVGADGDLHIDAAHMPRMNVSLGGSGFTMAGPTSKVAVVETIGGTEYYTATFDFTRTADIGTLTVGTPAVDGSAMGTPSDYMISRSQSGNNYSVTLMVKRSATSLNPLNLADGIYNPNVISLGVTGAQGYGVTLTQDDRFEEVNNEYYTIANGGGTATFTISLKSGYVVRDGSNYTVSKQSGSNILVTVSNVTEETVVTLDIGEDNGQNPQYHAFAKWNVTKGPAGGHDYLFENPPAPGPLPDEQFETGTLIGGTKQWIVGAQEDTTLVVTAESKNRPGVDLSDHVTVSYMGMYTKWSNSASANKYNSLWKVTISDIEEDVHIHFDLKPTFFRSGKDNIGGTLVDQFGSVVGTDGHEYAGILCKEWDRSGINNGHIADGEIALSKIEFTNVAPSAVDPLTATGNTIRFVLFVTDGCVVNNSGSYIVDDATSTVSVDNSYGGYNGPINAGYHPVLVTVKLGTPVDNVTGFTGVLRLVASYT